MSAKSWPRESYQDFYWYNFLWKSLPVEIWKSLFLRVKFYRQDSYQFRGSVLDQDSLSNTDIKQQSTVVKKSGKWCNRLWTRWYSFSIKYNRWHAYWTSTKNSPVTLFYYKQFINCLIRTCDSFTKCDAWTKNLITCATKYDIVCGFSLGQEKSMLVFSDQACLLV